MTSLSPRTRRVLAGAAAAAVVAAGTAGYAGRHELNEAWLKYQWRDRHYNGAVMEKALMIAGGNPTEAQNESKEAVTIEEQFAQARTAPGIVAPGAYGNAFAQLSSMPRTSRGRPTGSGVPTTTTTSASSSTASVAPFRRGASVS